MAIDWTQSNIMPYIQQLGQRIVNYELWTSVVWIVFGLLLIIGLSIILKKTIVQCMKPLAHVYDDNFGWYVVSILISVAICGTTLMVISQIFDIITCFTLPEKIWMNYIQAYLQK